jgi:sec-independent protein translocase protein TatA
MGIGSQEVLLLLFFALIFFGANRIPGIARGLGKGIAEFRRAARDIQNEITRTVEEEDRRQPSGKKESREQKQVAGLHEQDEEQPWERPLPADPEPPEGGEETDRTGQDG